MPHPSTLRLLRERYYRWLLLQDTPSDTLSVQDYNTRWHEAQHEARHLLAHLVNARDLQPDDEAELLLTIFIALQVGYRNWDLFEQATDRAYALLPSLSGDPVVTGTPHSRRLLCHLLVHLYIETEDDTLLPNIDRILSTWHDESVADEDRYLLEMYETARKAATA